MNGHRWGLRLRRVHLVVALAGALALTLATSASGASHAAPVRGGTFTMARVADIFTMDPVTSIDDRSIFTDLQIYDRLVKLTKNGKGVAPELAKSWKYSHKGRVITFKLRPHVKFSDGTPLTAADVVGSFNRERKPKNAWSFLIEPAVKSVTAVNRSTVRIKMSKPFAPLLPALATFAYSVYSQKAFKHWGAKAYGQHPVGTGAFMLQAWHKGSELDLVRNPHYWQRGKPYLDKLVFKVVGDDNSRVLQLESGAVDAIDSVPPNQVKPIEAQGLNVESVYGSAEEELILNTQKKRGPFADPKIRCAIAWSANRAAIAKVAYFGLAKPALSMMPTGSLYYDPHTHPYGYNLAKAKKCLEKSSRPHGFTFSVQVDAGDSPGITALQIWAASLKKIGITMKIEKLEATTTQANFNTQHYTARYVPWTNDTPDPDEEFGFDLDYKSAIHAAHTSYTNPAARTLMIKARGELNPKKRRADYAKLQTMLNKNYAPFIYVVDVPRLYASGKNVVGFSPNSQGKYSFENVWKTK